MIRAPCIAGCGSPPHGSGLPGARLNDLEREFLARSGAQEQDELHATRQRNRRLRALTAVLAVLLLVAGVTSGVALWQWQVVQDQRDLATARQLAAEAEALTSRDPQLANLLSLVAADIADTAETRSGLLNQLHRVDRVEKFLTGHSVAANGAAFSPDGTTLASAGGDGLVIVWDGATRTSQFVLDGHGGAANALAFSPDGRVLVSGHQNGSVIVWDLAQRTPRSVLTGHTGAVNSVVFSPDGRTVLLWDGASRTNLATLRGHTDEAYDVAFSPDGRLLVRPVSIAGRSCGTSPAGPRWPA